MYVDDFIALAQGSTQACQKVRDHLLTSIDQVFRPALTSEGRARQEPISVKKLAKGDACWATRKEILGWEIDTVAETIQLPTRRLKRLHALLEDYPRTKCRVAVKKWQQVLGELRSMTLAVPGLRGHFSLLQDALKLQALSSKPKPRVKLSHQLHDFLDDIRWIVRDLKHRPTRLQEVIPTELAVIGASDACQQGMGGVFFAATPEGHQAYYWREQFPSSISKEVVSWSNPTGRLTNSDLELAAILTHHDCITQEVDVRERTIHTLTDNTPAAAWQQKGSTSTTGPVAYLLRLQAMHQRHHRYLPKVSFIKGTCNSMADDCSRLWQLSTNELTRYLNRTYPQATSWQFSPVQPNMAFSLISALHKKRPQPESWLHTATPKIAPGSFGSNSALNSPKIRHYKTLQSPLLSSKYSHEESGMDALQPAASPSNLQQWVDHWQPSARRSPFWGPRILA